jgi:hypothetical protein
MGERKVCRNPECGKEYVTDDSDDGYCSFECWEHIHCGKPPEAIHEDIHIEA